MSRISFSPSIHYCMVMKQGLASVNTVVYGHNVAGHKDERSVVGKGLARRGVESAGPHRLHRAEGRSAGEGDGGLARQLLLAFRRCRCVPRRAPEALA